MVKNTEQLLFLFTQSPQINFSHRLNGAIIKMEIPECSVTIEQVEDDNDFCKVSFYYKTKTDKLICRLSEINDFLDYAYDQLNLTSNLNEQYIKKIGIIEFLKQQEIILKILKNEHPDYHCKLIRNFANNYKLEAQNTKTKEKLQMNFEGEYISEKSKLGVLKGFISNYLGNNIDIFIPIKNLSEFKFFNYTPEIADKYQQIFKDISENVPLLNKITFKNDLEDSLNLKGNKPSHRAKI